jgi:glycosyltransferase involved in cell wall biosynthesis
MKASIIIPVYNVEPYIERCLLSALNQTYDDIEIILIDDCGQDKSMEVANQVIQNHKNGYKTTVLKHHQNKGLSEARNTGIKAAGGDYVYFLDSDDEITQDCIELLVKESEGYEVIIGGLAIPLKGIYLTNKKSTFKNVEIKNAYFDSLIYNMACNKLVCRIFLLSNKLFFEPELLHEDYLWTFFVSMVCHKLKTIEDMTYIYHIREKSITTSYSIKNINHFIIGFNKIENYLINNIDICKNKYKHLIWYKFYYKQCSINKANITFNEFKGLNFSKNEYPFFVGNFIFLCKNIVLRLPLYLQYKIFKIMPIIYVIYSFIKHIMKKS